MRQIEAHGISVALPHGFEGRIFVRPKIGSETTRPVAHFATFAMPSQVGDFGSGAVTLMKGHDAFAVLLEYGPESVGKALFARGRMPRSLRHHHFRPTTLRRGIPGQSGTQWFFVESGRPFTLYAVVGSHAMRHETVPLVNDLLGGITFAELP